MNEQEKAAFEKEIREKIAEENREKNRIYKAKWRERNREHIKNYDKVYRRKRHSDEILQYTLDGVLVAKYRTLREAADNIGCSKQAISQALGGISKTCCGFVLKYATEVFTDECELH